MEPSAAVFLLLVAVAVLVIAAYLIFVVATLYGVSRRLNIVLDSVDAVTEKALPAGPVLKEISRDLAGGREAIEACVERLQARQAQLPAAAPEPPRYP